MNVSSQKLKQQLQLLKYDPLTSLIKHKKFQTLFETTKLTIMSKMTIHLSTEAITA
ncbi:hypothetical protein Hanom_Chr14g01323451 [Helianthus anomalus]